MALIIAVIVTVILCYFIVGFAVAALDGKLSQRNRGYRIKDTLVVMLFWPLSVVFWVGTL